MVFLPDVSFARFCVFPRLCLYLWRLQVLIDIPSLGFLPEVLESPARRFYENPVSIDLSHT